MMRLVLAGLLLVVQPVPEPAPAGPDPAGPSMLPDAPSPPAPDAAPPIPATEREGYRVVRGTAAAAGSAPWQVQIFTTVPIPPEQLAADRALPASSPDKKFYDDMSPHERDHLCGGALIAPDWAITAAHCFVDRGDQLRPLASRRVRLGNNYLPSATEMAIDRVIIHADYRRTGDKRHDIALIHLVADAHTDTALLDYTKPIRLPAAAMRPLAASDLLKVTGWGMTGENDDGAARDIDGKPLRGTPLLLEGRLNLADAARCRAVPSMARTVWDGVLCVAGDTSGQDSCQGDSGGPLTRQGVLVGLVSTGSGCGRPGVPALYTRVETYRGWIRTVMAASRPGMNARCRARLGSRRPALNCQR